MTILYYDPIFLEHKTGDHPESTERIIPAARRMQLMAFDNQSRRPAWGPATLDRLLRVHSPDYLDSIQKLAASGGGAIDADTVVSARSYDVASMAAGAVCDAVERVLKGEDETAFCLVRPPGHHALADRGMGFCLFNNVAVGSRLAIDELGLDRVMIVDWDVHHGNGTQATFWEDPQVGYFSIHRSPFYPWTGTAEETGVGAARGTTLNLPISFGTPRDEYLETFAEGVERFAAALKPQLILISAGFDAHRLDPVGSLGLESEDFSLMTKIVLRVAATHAGGRVVSVLEGGYNPVALADCVEHHLHELLSI